MDDRRCPLCGEHRNHTLAELEPADFCDVNYTYSRDFRRLLALPAEARFPIRRCATCGFVYAGLLPDQSFLTKLYDVVIQEAQCVQGSENYAGYARRLRYVAELIELAPAGPALDFGSGLGVTLRILAACGIDAIGYDPSVLRRQYSGASSVTSDPDEIARRGPYAILVLDNVLEHLSDPVATIERLHDMSMREAVAYVSVPAYERDFLEKQLDAHRRGEPLDMTFNPWEHLNYFSRAHLDALMNRGGFRRIRASKLAAAPPIGLRAEESPVARMKNAAASALRLVRYAVTGDGLRTAEHAFYRRD